MSTSERRRRRIRRREQDGFSLLEVVLAMGLLSVVLMAALPMLLSMMRSTVTTKMNTQAKNLSQERLEQLRDLRFHIDRQNGPFLDLLDLYYTNATPTAPVTSIPSGAGTLSGRYYGTGTRSGVAAPLFEVTTGALAGAADFSQIVLAQFLGADGAILPAARYEGLYDSQVQGKDVPPSLMVRFTVITSWVQAGVTKTYRTTTVITDGSPELPVIQTQAKAVGVSVTSTGADAATLQVQAGVASLDGAQSSGSSVSGYVTGVSASRTNASTVTGQVAQFDLPDQAVATTGSGGATGGGSGCSWYGWGPNVVENASGAVTSGLPKAPANVDSGGVVKGAVKQGSNNSCGLLSFDNLVGGGVARSSADTIGVHMGAAPFLRVPDSNVSAVGIEGAAYVTATSMTASPHQARSGARVAMGKPVVVFPGSPTSGPVPSTSPTYDGSSKGLVRARVTSGKVDCVSGSSTSTGTVVGEYVLVLEWWGKGPGDTSARWHATTYDYKSDRSTPLTVTGDTWTPGQTDLGNGHVLSDVVQVTVPSATAGVVSEGATTGLRGFPNGVVSIATASTLQNEPSAGYSAVKVQLGQLTCVADDQR